MKRATFICQRVTKASRENPAEAHFLVAPESRAAGNVPHAEVRIINFDGDDFQAGKRYQLAIEETEEAEEQPPAS